MNCFNPWQMGFVKKMKWFSFWDKNIYNSLFLQFINFDLVYKNALLVDEIRMLVAETNKNALLVDTKTRVQSTLPVEPHRRNGRLQLMCYKHKWDNLAAEQFPDKKFFDFFSLNPYHNLSEEIIESSIQSGFPAKSQQDNSLLGEYQFAYDLAWLQNQIRGCLEFWRGQREASYTPEEE
ncbi:hypothetical protein UlMin_004425 [Ulmus minor]